MDGLGDACDPDDDNDKDPDRTDPAPYNANIHSASLHFAAVASAYQTPFNDSDDDPHVDLRA